jgi:hypothetical protein
MKKIKNIKEFTEKFDIFFHNFKTWNKKIDAITIKQELINLTIKITAWMTKSRKKETCNFIYFETPNLNRVQIVHKYAIKQDIFKIN